VTIVAVDAQDKLAMVRNFRVAVGDWLLELPAGKLERGEEPRLAAGRELEEETGYAAKEVTALGSFYTSPGFADELMHVFLAEDLSFVGQRLEPGETIQAELVGVDEVWAMIRDGRIRDGKTIAAMTLWREAQRKGPAR
jgi:ADP-ribose pyrophosphatase